MKDTESKWAAMKTIINMCRLKKPIQNITGEQGLWWSKELQKQKKEVRRNLKQFYKAENNNREEKRKVYVEEKKKYREMCKKGKEEKQ